MTCPAGNTVTLSRTRIATFGVACRDCPLRDRCTTCKTGRKLVLHERDDLLRAARADWAADPGLREDYWRTGRTWNAPSPRWRPAGVGGSSSATAGWPRTTPGSNAAPPRSTCATCSARA